MILRWCALLSASSCLLGAQTGSESSLDAAVRARLAKFPGSVSIAAKNLATGKSYGLDAEKPVRTASTIKLAIMIECFYEAAENKLQLTEPVTLTQEEKVSGSGILQDLTSGDALPIRDLVDLMIVLSDNTATNLILNRIGGNAVNARMAQLGIQNTRVMRKILGDGTDLKPFPSGITEEGAKPENKKWGIGRSSPQDMLMLLEKLYQGKLVNKQASDEMLTILKHQRDTCCMGRDMPDVTVAHKTGALDHLRSDVGIIYAKSGPIAMAITVEGIPQVDYGPDNAGDLLISALSETLANGLGTGQ
jgi:beta-lactamase class A